MSLIWPVTFGYIQGEDDGTGDLIYRVPIKAKTCSSGSINIVDAFFRQLIFNVRYLDGCRHLKPTLVMSSKYFFQIKEL